MIAPYVDSTCNVDIAMVSTGGSAALKALLAKQGYSELFTLSSPYQDIWYASKKMMPQFGTHFRESVYGAAPPRIGRLLPKTGRLQAEKRKASYEKAEGFLRKG